jgi:TolB protein
VFALRTIALVALGCLALFAGTDTAPAAFPGYNGRIAFETDRDGNSEIYSIGPDGTNPSNLSNNPASDVDPAWSPDGTKIAFSSDRDGHPDIWANGTARVNLTPGPEFDEAPTWSC